MNAAALSKPCIVSVAPGLQLFTFQINYIKLPVSTLSNLCLFSEAAFPFFFPFSSCFLKHAVV